LSSALNSANANHAGRTKNVVESVLRVNVAVIPSGLISLVPHKFFRPPDGVLELTTNRTAKLPRIILGICID
ncbi:MAG: hypothetical protein QGG48_11745, partial [Desulfatiglandales bacterium]|nr:hypothetical protein [Desulfatiglandales bacterium]